MHANSKSSLGHGKPVHSLPPVIGIGASAGGLEALSELLAALPRDIGATFLVVQHMDRNQESALPDILSQRTQLAVERAAQGVVPLIGHVYVIQPNTTLTLAEGRLRLETREPGRQPHKPVDALFYSLAVECGARCAGIVMSGADSDGAAGTAAIKQAGGITFAQSPETARVPSMPRTAIETGCVDFVLPPEAIATELSRLVMHPYLHSTPMAAAEDKAQRPAADEERHLLRIFRQLHTAHDIDFSGYKPSTLKRRLARRMALRKIADLHEYTGLVETDPAEAADLYKDFLIHVTSFFRDPDAFSALTGVFPQVCEGRSQKNPIRIWVPGCASGEEVYSIAIALLEFLGDRASSTGIQIFGSDVSELAIGKARSGLYPESIAQDVSPERLSRFFIKQDDGYCISRLVRDLCIFAQHDVTRDPPFSRLDLISCRNLLIYLAPAAQLRVMQTFHYALRRQGILVLGPSESVGAASDLFELGDKAHRFYTPRWKGTGMNADVQRPSNPVNNTSAETDAAVSSPLEFNEADSVLRLADRLFLARYAPAGILVDGGLEILQYRGEVGPYLAPASGPPAINLRRVMRPELLVEMLAALEQVRNGATSARRPELEIEGVGMVGMEVIALSRPGGAPCYLFIFEEASRHHVRRRERVAQGAARTESEKDNRIAHLERENVDLREVLHATLEQHEAAREELKSAHEEVLSANEEFQSTNEELETSKEELQSGNEELITTNEELRDRNRQRQT
jgi:two-component system CheB/CheR fusion protein